jgi:anti-sigma factor RsiW
VREALPDLLHGRLSPLDTATMNAHVESCADCRAELELLREVRASAPLAPPMDYDRIAASLPAYGGIKTSAPPRTSVRVNFRTIGIVAAGLVVAFAGWSMTRSSLNPGQPSTSVVASAPVTSVVTPSTTAETLPAEASKGTSEIVSGETQVASLSLVGSTQDLSDADLEQLTSDLEELEALPSAEPQTVTLAVEDNGNNQ